MAENLFLEGPVQLGKSTLLRKMLRPYIGLIGGFASQRMVDDHGRTVAFRIGPAAETALSVPYRGNENLPGIFRRTDESERILKSPEVFDTLGVRYLTENHGKKLILLDEIGGAELLSCDFRKALYDVLAADIPCIGVMKLEQSASFMSATAGYSGEVMKQNRRLRRNITEEYNGKIVEFKRESALAEREIEVFLCGIFTTK